MSLFYLEIEISNTTEKMGAVKNACLDVYSGVWNGDACILPALFFDS
jgi:hypothetical protein